MNSIGISRRRLLKLSGAATAAGALGLGSQASYAQSASVKVWDQYSSEPMRSAFQKVLDRFGSDAGYNLIREVQLGASIKDIAATALSSGTGPDLLQYSVGQGNAGLLADANLIIPLDDYAAEYGWQDRLSSIALLEASLGGRIWGGPQESEVSMLFVNKTLFAQLGLDVPSTHEEMIAVAKEAKKAGVIALAYGQQDWFPSWWAASNIFGNAMGAKATADLTFNNVGSLNTPEVVDGLEKFCVELPEAGAFVDQVNSLPFGDAQALFQAGGALMLLTGTWSVGAIEETMTGVDVDIMPMWSFDGKPRAYPTGSGSAMYISAASEAKDETAALINFLYEVDMVKLMIEEASIIGPVEVDASTLNLSHLQMRSAQSVSTGDGDPAVTQSAFVHHGLGGSNLHKLLTGGFQAIFSGDTTAKELAADLQAAWEKDNS
ncbi:MAG: ABC transporter substrate-binding protein [Marinosulfonomonas sp.]